MDQSPIAEPNGSAQIGPGGGEGPVHGKDVIAAPMDRGSAGDGQASTGDANENSIDYGVYAVCYKCVCRRLRH